MNPTTAALLQEILRRESRSLLQYLNDAFPWTVPEKQEAVCGLKQLAAEQQQAAAQLGQFLLRRHVPLPYLGSFPEEFTSINFIGLDYAFSRLIAETQRTLAKLNRERELVADPEARRLLDELNEQKQRHLKELEALGGGVPATTLR